MDKTLHAPEVPASARQPGWGWTSDRPSMGDLLHLLGASSDAVAAGADMPIPVRRLHTGDSLFHEGAPADAIYFVRAGTFKTFCTAEDGYEQVLGFAGRTEVLGFDAVCMERHPTAAVALEESSVYVVLVRDMFALGRHIPGFDRVVALAVSRALTHRGELADVMAAVAAEVRLARFLSHLSQRMLACGESPRRLRLRMSRRDIASHLGVAHETVSRSFHALSEMALVHVSNREVEIIDMDGLKAFSRSTRRQVEEPARATHTRTPAANRPILHAPVGACAAA